MQSEDIDRTGSANCPALCSLPLDVLLIIIEYLDNRTLVAFGGVCKWLRNYAETCIPRRAKIHGVCSRDKIKYNSRPSFLALGPGYYKSDLDALNCYVSYSVCLQCRKKYQSEDFRACATRDVNVRECCGHNTIMTYEPHIDPSVPSHLRSMISWIIHSDDPDLYPQFMFDTMFLSFMRDSYPYNLEADIPIIAQIVKISRIRKYAKSGWTEYVGGSAVNPAPDYMTRTKLKLRQMICRYEFIEDLIRFTVCTFRASSDRYQLGRFALYVRFCARYEYDICEEPSFLDSHSANRFVHYPHFDDPEIMQKSMTMFD